MINNQLIKVCGMTEGENIRAIEALGVDLIGFIFYPGSPRYVRETPSYLPRKAKRVGVDPALRGGFPLEFRDDAARGLRQRPLQRTLLREGQLLPLGLYDFLENVHILSCKSAGSA